MALVPAFGRLLPVGAASKVARFPTSLDIDPLQTIDISS